MVIVVSCWILDELRNNYLYEKLKNVTKQSENDLKVQSSL